MTTETISQKHIDKIITAFPDLKDCPSFRDIDNNYEMGLYTEVEALSLKFESAVIFKGSDLVIAAINAPDPLRIFSFMHKSKGMAVTIITDSAENAQKEFADLLTHKLVSSEWTFITT